MKALGLTAREALIIANTAKLNVPRRTKAGVPVTSFQLIKTNEMLQLRLIFK